MSFWVSDTSFWVSDTSFWVSDWSFWVSDVSFWVSDRSFWVSDMTSWLSGTSSWLTPPHLCKCCPWHPACTTQGSTQQVGQRFNTRRGVRARRKGSSPGGRRDGQQTDRRVLSPKAQRISSGLNQQRWPGRGQNCLPNSQRDLIPVLLEDRRRWSHPAVTGTLAAARVALSRCRAGAALVWKVCSSWKGEVKESSSPSGPSPGGIRPWARK